MATVALLATVLRRWSGQDDLVIGVAVNTRRDAGVDALLGLFVNTVALRVDLTGRPAFDELLRRVRRATLDDCVNHGETQLDLLLRELRVVARPVADTAVPDPAQHGRHRRGRLAAARHRGGGRRDRRSSPARSTSTSTCTTATAGSGWSCSTTPTATTPRRCARSWTRLVALLPAVAADPARGILEYELPGRGRRCARGGAVRAHRRGPARRPVRRPGLVAFGGADRGGAPAARCTCRRRRTRMRRSIGCAPRRRPPRTSRRRCCGRWPRARPGRELPRLRYAFVANRGDLTTQDVERLRQLAPACQVVSVYVRATGRPRRWPLTRPVARGRSTTRPAARADRHGVADPAAVRNGPGSRPRPVRSASCTSARWPPVILVRRRRGRPAGVRRRRAGDRPYADPLETVTALRDLPDVQDALVTGVAATAYVAGAGGPVDLARLRQHLVTRLPEYLIPRQLVVRRPAAVHGQRGVRRAGVTSGGGGHLRRRFTRLPGVRRRA